MYSHFRAAASSALVALALSLHTRAGHADEPTAPPPVTYPHTSSTDASAPASAAGEPENGAATETPAAPARAPRQPAPAETSTAPQGGPLLGGVGMGIGAAFGGDTLLTADFVDGSQQKLHAGQGLTLSLRAFLTPLWVAESVGFGVGLEWGWKYTGITADNASVSFRRFPFEATARVLVEVSPLLHLVFAGGVHYETGIVLSASGAVVGEAHIDPALGGTGEFGVLYAKKHVGFDVTFRYTRLTYKGNGATAGASSGGIYSGIFYVF